MNTSLISRLTSFGIALTMTFVMLASVNSLATSEPSAAQMSQQSTVVAASQA
jgi:hypothetical protein